MALTFDDGPGPWTAQVLDVLSREHVHATFFMIGRRATNQPTLVRRVAAGGHAIEDHTWTHHTPSPAVGWQAKTLTTELDRTQRRLSQITGRTPCLFRPPGGVVKGARPVSRAADLSIVLWSVDTRDWTGEQASVIVHRADAGLAQSHPIVLLHDGGGNRTRTVAALPTIIAAYRDHGYTFVTLDGRT